MQLLVSDFKNEGYWFPVTSTVMRTYLTKILSEEELTQTVSYYEVVSISLKRFTEIINNLPKDYRFLKFEFELIKVKFITRAKFLSDKDIESSEKYAKGLEHVDNQDLVCELEGSNIYTWRLLVAYFLDKGNYQIVLNILSDKFWDGNNFINCNDEYFISVFDELLEKLEDTIDLRKSLEVLFDVSLNEPEYVLDLFTYYENIEDYLIPEMWDIATEMHELALALPKEFNLFNEIFSIVEKPSHTSKYYLFSHSINYVKIDEPIVFLNSLTERFEITYDDLQGCNMYLLKASIAEVRETVTYVEAQIDITDSSSIERLSELNLEESDLYANIVDAGEVDVEWLQQHKANLSKDDLTLLNIIAKNSIRGFNKIGTLYTSYFGKKVEIGKTFGICRQPKVAAFENLIELSPSEDLMNAYKDGGISFETFLTMYIEQVRINPEAQKTIRTIKALLDSGINVTLKCFEKDILTCHRYGLPDIFCEYKVEEIV